MDCAEMPAIAVVKFGAAPEANRRVAGVAAAARIIRELSAAGFVAVWIELPAGEALSPGTNADIQRLAGSMEVRIGTPPAAEQVCEMPATRLIRAREIPAFLAGCELSREAELRLDAADASAQIVRRAGKGGDGLVSRWLNRPISQRLTAMLLLIPGLRPVHATIGTALLALLMFVALSFGGRWGLIAGGVLFQAASIFDGVDGEIARSTFRTSPAGAILDTVVDVATNLLFIVGVTINLGGAHEQAYMLGGVGLSLLLLGLGVIGWRSVGRAGHFNLDGVKHHYSERFSDSAGSQLIRFLTIVSSRDFFALLFMVLIVVGLPMGVLYIFAAATSVWILFVAGSLLPKRGAAPEGA
jgi:1L-myo-inositol 1-phosphate cytidylyltransferase / CDP-L-myo-inositol myo-inositolphosphotransferase